MEIILSDTQREKLDSLVANKRILEEELGKVSVHINDVLELILDFNGIEQSNVENIEILDGKIKLSVKADS